MLRLDIDTNRDGEIDPDEPGRWDWGWGAGKPGAIVAVDCDRDATGDAVRADHAFINLVVDEETAKLGGAIRLSLDPASAPYVALWYGDETEAPLMGALESGQVQQTARVPLRSVQLRLQALSFPTASFDGLVEIVAALVGPEGQTPTDSRGRVIVDRALFRVAPWIMPTTLAQPEEVFMVDQGAANGQMKERIQTTCDALGIDFTVISIEQAGGDIWIQDEIEIGYTRTPRATGSVVLDGPRDRELDGLADAYLKRDGVGVWNIHAHVIMSSLDSFGNLEVSPPLTVGGVEYPLGRIILGSKKSIGLDGRKSSLALRQFLYSQKVQAPVEVFTDWLAVGHIDEIVSFVPFDNDRGFRVLLGSTAAFHDMLKKLAEDGRQDAYLWRGLRRRSGASAERTVGQLLGASSDIDWAYNTECDENILRVRNTLKEHLALTDDDFAVIPSAFADVGGEQALAYFPGMVNHLVLGEASIVPDPYGPVVDGVDLLQQSFRDALGSRGQGAVFVDDWFGYHEAWGEVHCGTNVRRKPEGTPWWELNLPGLWDAAVQVN